ncbi:MAG TPA: hypothetical protein PKI89_03345, partial [Tepidiformaceae bacterium]|nr:hypothetical protein [Tepidiformaceae bacterium]
MGLPGVTHVLEEVGRDPGMARGVEMRAVADGLAAGVPPLGRERLITAEVLDMEAGADVLERPVYHLPARFLAPSLTARQLRFTAAERAFDDNARVFMANGHPDRFA